jgi:hypothetical protein
MDTAGLGKIAELISHMDAPYIAFGSAGSEAYRKAVNATSLSGAVVRFRATLSLSEGNGDYTYLTLFSNGTSELGSGVEIDSDSQVFTKKSTQVLNVECRITVQEVA